MCALRTPRRLATAAFLLLGLSAAVPAAAPLKLVEEARVRVMGTQIAGNWSEGRIRIVNGCTMVFLDRAIEGYTAMMLIAVRRLEIEDAGQWRAMDVRALLAREPKDCQQEGSD